MSMSVLEPYDTQMLDYPGDIDVPMHSSTFEPWFHEEVTMEDDPRSLHDSKTLPTVEVDMEDHVGESTEYEMADEVQNYQGGDELLDVEVYDASQAHTPTPIHDIDAAHIPRDHPPVSPYHSSPHLVPDILRTPPRHQTSPPLQSTVLNSTIERSIAASPGTDLQQEVDHHAVLDATAVNEFALSHPEEPTATHASETAPEPTESIEIADRLTSHESDLGNVPSLQTGSDPSLHMLEVSNPTATHVDLGVPTLQDSSEHVESAGYAQSTGLKEQRQDSDQQEIAPEQGGRITDPHEISEGVYIDPPPAVLVSLSSADDSEIYLFNLPLPKSGANSPSTGGTQPDHQVHTLLLQQRPILYYEPLTSVFEALRQEKYISRLPDLIEGELVLDAYDLELAVSEDNIYAREVTLHDLNVLHDAFDLSGPLRLHLQSINPRFIYRYHFLRGQIPRLNIAAETGADGEKLLNEDEPEENEDIEVHQPISERVDADEQKPNDDNEERYLRRLADYQETPNEGVKVAEEVTGDISQFPAELESLEGPGESAQLLDDQNKYTDEPGLETEAGDPAVQEGVYVSAEEDTDEVEYAEHVDGNDSIPDAPPEEILSHERIVDYGEETEKTHSLDEYPPTEPYSLDGQPLSQEATTGGGSAVRRPSFSLSTILLDDNDGGSKHAEDPAADGETPDDRGDNLTEIASGQADLDEYDVDYPDSNLVTPMGHQVELTDPEPSSSTRYLESMAQPDNLEAYDHEWDDSLDGEGDPDPTWDAEHETESNESSVTLSSKASSKRTYDEVEIEAEHDDGVSSPYSPGPKRPRVQ